MPGMKLYTRTGDDGTTGLFGGGRVLKDDPRVEAYGTVDELNAAIGLAAAALPDPGAAIAPARPGDRLQRDPRTGNEEVFGLIRAIFADLQSRLFDIGADLATPEGNKHEAKIQRITPEQVAEAERWIDRIDGGNAPMTSFVMPGGTELAARLHLARTVCRRAERLMVRLARTEPVTPNAIVYINRISDLLFAMARRANKEAGVPDVPWLPAKKRPADRS